MSRKYPDQTKREAIGIRQIHDDISFTRYTTAVRERALHRWRDRLRKKQSNFMSEKTFQSDIKRTQNHLVAGNSAETCQHAAARQMDGSTPPRVYILYLYTMPKHGYFMGILWVFYGHLLGHSLRDRRSVSTRPTRPPMVKKFETIALALPYGSVIGRSSGDILSVN